MVREIRYSTRMLTRFAAWLVGSLDPFAQGIVKQAPAIQKSRRTYFLYPGDRVTSDKLIGCEPLRSIRACNVKEARLALGVA